MRRKQTRDGLGLTFSPIKFHLQFMLLNINVLLRFLNFYLFKMGNFFWGISGMVEKVAAISTTLTLKVMT